MRLVDQGKVKLDDPAYLHVDGPLKKQWNSSLYELYGNWSYSVTVRHLIFMTSGINDFEIGTRDIDLLS